LGWPWLSRRYSACNFYASPAEILALARFRPAIAQSAQAKLWSPGVPEAKRGAVLRFSKLGRNATPEDLTED